MLKENVSLIGASVIDGNRICVVVRIKDYIHDDYVDVSIPRDEFSPKVINQVIVRNGGICQDEKQICRSLKKSFDNGLITGNLEIQNFHNRLGWQKAKDGIIFLGKDAISADGGVQSSYSGRVNVEKVGNVENIIELIKSKIVALNEWSPLEAVISFGVGATVLAYANTAWGASLNNLIFHLMGGSSTGKSTSLTLFEAFGSNPNPKEGFWINFNSSSESVIQRIGDNCGYPVSIDELSGGKKKDYESFVYSVGNGEEKDRLKPGGSGFRDSATFQTVVLSSGEVSLLKRCSNCEGIRARCIELTNVNWTNSKQQSISIKECMRQNYGLITPMVAKELLDNDDKWRERWEYHKQQVNDRMEKDEIRLQVTERIADFVALFTLSAEIANEVLNVGLHVDAISKFCYEYIVIANEEEGNMATRAYSAIVEYISMHKDRFADATFYTGCRTMWNDITLTENEDGFFHNVRKKMIGDTEYSMVYVFRKPTIENILSDAGFSEPKISLIKLREEGYLKTKDKLRNTLKYKVNGSEQDCVAIYFKDYTLEEFELWDEN